MSKRRLGKGIDALLQGRDLEQLSNMASVLSVDIDRIEPNPDQPRKSFSDDSLRELADSITQKGIIQPILAEDRGDGRYVIIAGERRYRAARIAGLTEVPVISQEFDDDEKLEIALIENIQREDLNPVDEARALSQVIEHSGDTQEEVAKRLGKSRSAVANSIRLLKLEPEILEALAQGRISSGHARALLQISGSTERAVVFARIGSESLSVRAVEMLAAGESSPSHSGSADLDADADRTTIPDLDDYQLSGPMASGGASSAGEAVHESRSAELRRFETLLVDRFGTKAVIRGSDTRGRIELTYHSTEDLERLLELLDIDITGV